MTLSIIFKVLGYLLKVKKFTDTSLFPKMEKLMTNIFT